MGLIQWFGMKFSGGFSEEGWCFIYILPIITSAVFGYLWVQISYYVAPKNKKITTVFMTVLLVAILLVVTAFSLLDLNNGTSEKVQSVLGGIAIIVAAVYTIMDLQEK